MANSTVPPVESVEIPPNQESSKDLHAHLGEILAGGAAAIELWHLFKKWWRARELHREGWQAVSKGIISKDDMRRLPFGRIHLPKNHITLASNKREAAFIALSFLGMLWLVFRWLLNRAHYKHLQQMANSGGIAALHPSAAAQPAQPPQPAAPAAAAPAAAHGNDAHGDDHGHGGGGNEAIRSLLAWVGLVVIVLMFCYWVISHIVHGGTQPGQQTVQQAPAAGTSVTVPVPQQAAPRPVEGLDSPPTVELNCTQSSPCTDNLSAWDPSKNDDDQAWTLIHKPQGSNGARYDLWFNNATAATLREQCQLSDGSWSDFDPSHPDNCSGTETARVISTKKDFTGNYVSMQVSHYFVEHH